MAVPATHRGPAGPCSYKIISLPFLRFARLAAREAPGPDLAFPAVRDFVFQIKESQPAS